MGAVKRMHEEHEALRSLALDIAIEAGVLTSCKYHDDAIFEGRNDITEAYRLANTKATKGELNGSSDSRRKMTDAIKEVVENCAIEECPYCAKIRDND